jgi:hypothetical protein
MFSASSCYIISLALVMTCILGDTMTPLIASAGFQCYHIPSFTHWYPNKKHPPVSHIQANCQTKINCLFSVDVYFVFIFILQFSIYLFSLLISFHMFQLSTPSFFTCWSSVVHGNLYAFHAGRHTISAARACFLDDDLGSLSPGKLADFVILSTDSWDEFAAQGSASVEATYVAGLRAYPWPPSSLVIWN